MTTARQLADRGAKHIKRACWTEGRVYVDDDFWAFVHPHDTPDPHPFPVRIDTMLPGDDWEEIEVVKKKVSKASVHYREATGTRTCGNCAMFHAGTCDLVLGKIERSYLCDKWVKRA